MKPLKLIIHNVGIIADETIPISKPLIIFYGEIRAGKTTVLNCVRWVCGGEFPADILRHGSKEAHIELQFEHGHLRREFYLAKDGKTVKARSLEFVVNGRPVSKPVDEVAKLLNPFTLDQDFLVRKNEKDRNTYFIGLFGVDTSDLDGQLTALEGEASAIRSELKGFGEVDLTEHKPVNVMALQDMRKAIVDKAATARRELEAELESINDAHEKRCDEYNKAVNAKRDRESSRKLRIEKIEAEEQEINRLKILIGQAEDRIKAHREWLATVPELELPSEPKEPDTTALKQKILDLHTPDTKEVDALLSDASAANVRAEQYQKNLARENVRKAKAATLLEKENAIKAKRQAKLDRLKDINESCKIEGLKFTDDGEFSFEGTSAAMLSTSQLVLLSKKLSDLYPPGLGIQILDRAESLGKSIFTLIDRAKVEEKTILASVVGERPATVPEQVGVFVVENGKVTT